MKKKKIIAVTLIFVTMIGVFLTFILVTESRNKQAGQEKFNKAMSELRMSTPQYNNPCLGSSILRDYSYSELSKKSIVEIKELAKMDLGSC